MTHRFLELLFGAKEPEHYFYIWTFPDRISAFFRSIDEGVEYCEKRKKDSNVYVGCALTDRAYEPNQRIKIAEGRKPAGIVGNWGDVDFEDPGHKKAGLPPDLKAARSVLFDRPKASIIVHTGGGIQPWYLFKEPWALETDKEIQRAAIMATRWNRGLKARAASNGWSLDSVGDLSRVLRVPGTFNLKIPGQPRPVTILEEHSDRTNPSDAEEFLDLFGVQQVSYNDIVLEGEGKLTYSMAAEPPVEKLMALLDNDKKFKATFEKRRKDLDDQSPSSYDLALANVCVQAEWTDQEIVDLIIHFRKKHGDEIVSKLRDTYFLPTLRKARSLFKHQESLNAIDTILHTPAAGSGGPKIDPDAKMPIDDDKAKPEAEPDPAQRKAQLCSHISDALGLPEGMRIIKVSKFMTDPPEYRLHLQNGSIHVGTIGGLITQAALQMQIAAAGNQMIPSFKGPQWRRVSQALLDACIEVHVGDEGTDAGQIKGWMMSYLEQQPPAPSIAESSEAKLPFQYHDRIAVYVPEFVRFLHRHFSQQVPQKKVSIMMQLIQARRVTINYTRTNGDVSTRSVWLIDPALLTADTKMPPPSEAGGPKVTVQ